MKPRRWTDQTGRKRGPVPVTPRRLAFALCAFIVLTACTGNEEPRERAITAFGTIVRVQVAGADPERADAALGELAALYRALDREWRSFGEGELGRANARLAAGHPVDLSPALARLVARSVSISAASGGLFDPRVGSLVALWGFQDLTHELPRAPPDEAALQDARRRALAATLRLDGTRLAPGAPVSLELAGIAKGAALAEGARLLAARGIADALIVAGGDVIVLGTRGDRPWRIGVRDPLGEGIIGTVDLEPGEAALSSGNYERRFESGGRRYHHIMDPRTGRPARGAAGTTVLHHDAELGNAAAAALMVGGPEHFAALATRLGVDCALLVAEDGRRLMTPCMRRRLHAP